MKKYWLLIVVAIVGLAGCAATSVAPGAAEERIVVFGASGKSGRYILSELQQRNRSFIAITSNAARAREKVPGDYDWREVDVRDPDAVRAVLTDATAVISALGATSFKGANGPQFVDYEGVRNVVDAAVDAGVAHLVLISASGVTNPDHPLNKLGDVMVWKLKGEDHLRASGLNYTIIRPGGLLDMAAGTHRLVLRQGDDLPYTSKLSVTSRADVAVLSIAALDDDAFGNVTLEAFNDRNFPADDSWRQQLDELVAD